MVVVRSLNGLKSSGSAWRMMFTEALRIMDFLPTVADIDVYCRQARKPNGEHYYELLLVYVDDSLCCSHNHRLIMDVLTLLYDLKDRLLGPPMIYFGTEIKKYQVNSAKSHWIMPDENYVKNVINTI